MSDLKNIKELFLDNYEDPVIKDVTPQLPYWIPELRLYSVYEKSWECEDPLVPENWIITTSNEKFKTYDILKVLKKLNISPKSEKEALNIAIMIFNTKFQFNHIFLEPPKEFEKLPKNVIPKITKPLVLKKGNYYEIYIYIYFHQYGPFRFEIRPSCTLERWKVKIGLDIYEISQDKIIWEKSEGNLSKLYEK